MDDRKIILLLFERDESALVELSGKYSSLCKSVLRGILRDESDVEECYNDVLLGIWNSIPPNEPENLSAYACTISRRMGINKLRHNTAKKRSSDHLVLLSELEECLPDGFADSEESDGHLKEVLDGFIRRLDVASQVLFIRRYVYLEETASLAERFGMSENNVRVRLFRVRKRLKKLLKKEGIDI